MVNLTSKNKENLVKVARYLWEKVSQSMFDMEDLIRGFDYSEKPSKALEILSCGAVGCILGHAPNALELDLSIHDESFPCYDGFIRWVEKEMIGITTTGDEDKGLVWDFLFIGDWACFDNSVEGAVKRLLYVSGECFSLADMWLKYDSIDYREWMKLYENIQIPVDWVRVPDYIAHDRDTF